MVKNLALLVGLIAFAPANAQIYSPNDIDMKSAYCLGRLKAVERVDASAFPQEAKDHIEALNRKIASARSRLSSYLESRLTHLDVTGLTDVIHSGEHDQASYEQNMLACKAMPLGTDADRARFASCYSQAGWGKLKECEEAAFLPF